VSIGTILRLALDQNFPTPLIEAVRPYLPTDLEVTHLRGIDRRMSDLDDRSLIIALRQAGWDGLITNNYKMLDVPAEVAAIVKTKLTVVAVEGLGHDPIPRRWSAAVGAAWHRRTYPTQAIQCAAVDLPPQAAARRLGVLLRCGPPDRSGTSRPVEFGRRYRRGTTPTRSHLRPTPHIARPQVHSRGRHHQSPTGRATLDRDHISDRPFYTLLGSQVVVAGGRRRSSARGTAGGFSAGRRGSGLPIGFWVGDAGRGEEDVGGGGQGGVVVPAGPAATFELVKSDTVFSSR